MYIAASRSSELLGSLGAGGLALVLTTVLILGTRDGSKHTLKPAVACVIGLCAGTVWMSAGQLWGLPDDMVMGALTAITETKVMGDVGTGAIALVLVAVVYLVQLKARAAGVTGAVMASVFAIAGGGWAMVSSSIGQMFAEFAA
jgi:hypothetical protein